MNDLRKAEIRRILTLVYMEVVKQDGKWGLQDHPDGTSHLFANLRDQTMEDANQAAREDNLTWAHILDEEFMEALAEEQPQPLTEELIQVAAVAVNWIDCLMRRAGAHYGDIE